MSEIVKLEPKPGDVIVYMTPDTLSAHQMNKILDYLKIALETMGIKDVGVMILDRGASLAVITPEKS